jgi:hypothetical protein
MPSKSLTKFINTLSETDREIVNRPLMSDKWDSASVKRLGALIPTFEQAGFDTVNMEVDYDLLLEEHVK